LPFWTALFLTVELIIFGIASGWVIYNDQLEAFSEIRGQPTSRTVIKKETAELIFDLTGAYTAALAVAVPVAALGVWWSTRKALQPLQEVASAAEQINAKALNQRLPGRGACKMSCCARPVGSCQCQLSVARESLMTRRMANSHTSCLTRGIRSKRGKGASHGGHGGFLR
jgi:hypothetical protein